MSMIRKIKFSIPFAILTVLLVLLWNELSSNRQAFANGMVGEDVPSFKLPGIYGGSLTDNRLQGKASVLVFWASWCAACRSESSTLIKVSKKYGVPIYGIAYKDSKADAKAFLGKYGNPFRQVAYDEYGDVGVDFGIYATPELFVISPSGKIIYKQIGVVSMSSWKRTILPLLKKY